QFKWHLSLIETGGRPAHKPLPTNGSPMTLDQARDLWLRRAADNFYMERGDLLPRGVGGRTVWEGIPLLNFGWQGFVPVRIGKNLYDYAMHSVWDDRPAARAAEAVISNLFLRLTGEVIETEVEMIARLIKGMRDAGWGHVDGEYTDYAGIAQRGSVWGYPVYNYEDVLRIHKGECHINANFLVARLRPFNIPVHIGPRWTTLQGAVHYLLPWDSPDQTHVAGHCYVHFPTIRSWLAHGDDVQNGLWRNIPAEFAFQSDSFAHDYLFNATKYIWERGRNFNEYTWWCLLIARDPQVPELDVPFLYQHDQ